MAQLTDMAIKHEKGPGKLVDGRGLYLLINSNGSRLWRFNYRFGGKYRTLALGKYPAVKLADARRKHEDARRLLDQGIDPGEKRKEDRVAAKIAEANTFGVLKREYIEWQRNNKKLAVRTMEKNGWYFSHTAPLDDRPMAKITPKEILEVLQKLEVSGRNDTAHTLRGMIGAVFRYAMITERAPFDPTQALRNALAPVKVTPRAALTDETKFGRLLVAIDEYDGWPTLKCALQFAALTFQRPGEVRLAEWKELKGKVWEIPEQRAKQRRPHDVPLSKQALAVLDSLRPLTGDGRLIFPSIRSHERPLSENAMNAGLRRMGYTQEEHCAHGFRASASTILNTRKYRKDVIEMQLGHLEPNEVRRAYNRAEYWDERVPMMQEWADPLDKLKRPKRDHSDLI